MGFSGSAPEKKPEAVASGNATPAAQSSDDIVAVIAAGVAAANNEEIIAVISAAVMACCGGGQIACIRRLSGNAGWSNLAHIEAVSVRNQMF